MDYTGFAHGLQETLLKKASPTPPPFPFIEHPSR
jgi:hypothetical protein